MNITSIYDKAAGHELKLMEGPEKEESAQIIISDTHVQWLQNPITIALFDFLQSKRAQLLEEAVVCVEEETKIKKKLHQAALIKEIIEYAREYKPNTPSRAGK